MGTSEYLECHHAQRVDVRSRRGMLHPPSLWRCVHSSERELLRVWRSGRLRITRDAEVSNAPVAFEEQDVLRFEVAMDDLRLEVDQRIAHVLQYGDRFRKAQPIARRHEELSQRHFCTRHHEHPEVAMLAVLNDGNHVSDAAKVDE